MSFQAAVRDTQKADRITLLDVYRDGYALRLIEVLTTDYPGLMAMAGPADFDHMARAYIAAHPSRHPSVRWFGKDVADFLSRTPPYSRTPAAAEMARFEWALGEAFDFARRDARRGRRADGAAARGVGDARLHRPALAAAARRLPSTCRRPGSAARRSSRAISRSSARPGPCAGRSGGPSSSPTSARSRTDDAALARRAGRGPALPRSCAKLSRPSPARSRPPPAPPACYAPGSKAA